jgi:hypothetical protein
MVHFVFVANLLSNQHFTMTTMREGKNRSGNLCRKVYNKAMR